MNNYPAWWEDTITVYNKFEDETTKQITWYRTVITDCFWKYASMIDVTTYLRLNYSGIQETGHTVICRIPKNEKYLDKGEWRKSTNKSMYFTLAPGDILVKGNCETTINEYESGKRSNDFMRTQKLEGDCVQINQVQINTGHRCLEHYYVTGE